MTMVFVSDLHLSDDTPLMTDLFCQLLIDYTEKSDGLFILGDFFDVWTGDDDPGDTGNTVMGALQTATRKGLPIALMHGNRDFLLGNHFLKTTGCTLLPDRYVLNLYGTPVLLMHGDTLCTKDIAYLKFRRWSRLWFMKKLFQMKSRETRRAIATRYRTASMAHTANTAADIMDVTQQEVENEMRRHKVQQLIHGHTHRPEVHSFLLDDQPARRTVLPAWHGTGGALLCKADGSQELISF